VRRAGRRRKARKKGDPTLSPPSEPRGLRVDEAELIPPDPQRPETRVLELDELWSFVLRREDKVWVWLALCRGTRQVVGCAVGDRSADTCKALWESLPEAFRECYCYSDFWEAYAKVLPPEQHSAVGKESGETAHVERWNNTLRQRLARFTRKTLSFSKTLRMHRICLLRFIHRYNRLKKQLWLQAHPA
jgi:IS1 family transposase